MSAIFCVLVFFVLFVDDIQILSGISSDTDEPVETRDTAASQRNVGPSRRSPYDLYEQPSSGRRYPRQPSSSLRRANLDSNIPPNSSSSKHQNVDFHRSNSTFRKSSGKRKASASNEDIGGIHAPHVPQAPSSPGHQIVKFPRSTTAPLIQETSGRTLREMRNEKTATSREDVSQVATPISLMVIDQQVRDISPKNADTSRRLAPDWHHPHNLRGIHVPHVPQAPSSPGHQIVNSHRPNTEPLIQEMSGRTLREMRNEKAATSGEDVSHVATPRSPMVIDQPVRDISPKNADTSKRLPPDWQHPHNLRGIHAPHVPQAPSSPGHQIVNFDRPNTEPFIQEISEK